TVNAYWKAMWADSGLFVLVNVQDDNHYPAWEAGSFETWTYDLSEVALDVNAVLDDGLGAQHNQGHYLHSGVFLEALYGSPIQNGIFTYANQLSGENRITEYYIPFSEMQNKNGNFLNKDSLLLLDAIGFDVCVIDQDQGITDRRHRKVWQNTGSANENWSNMDDAGTIQLIDAPVRLSDSVLVTFRVDMRDELVEPMGVNLIGSFNNWTSDAMTCTNDKVYEITLELPKNTYFEYKFRNGNMWESPEGDCNAGGGNTNRTLNVASENLILDLVCYNSCFLCPPSYIEVAKTETAPVLDGVIDDVWNDFDAIPVSKNYLWENPTVNAYWKAMWADSGIFVLIDVQDDVHFPAWEAGSSATWEYDDIEVYFDVNENLLDGLGSKDGSGHYTYSPVFAETAYGTVQNTGPVSYSNLLYDENFVSEMFFPFESFENDMAQPLTKNSFLLRDAIGFDVYVIDRDSAETNRQRKVWQNNGLITENWANMDDAGTIRLIGEAPNFDLIESDSLALVALYNATGGDNWNNKQNWLTSNASEWFGVRVENCRVVELNLGENNLSGQLPAELANLTALRTLNLGGNGNLGQGAIPDLSGLFALRELVLYSCNRSGTVPDWLLQSSTIERINISGNALTGAIPTNFSYPLNIRTLDVGWCQFDTPSGFPNFSAFANLENLRLAGCNITAQVPAYFEGFANLFNLHIDNNHLWGDLPAGLKSQTNLTNLDIQWNNFTFGNFAAAGIVPSQMGGMNYEPQANVQLGRSETETQVTFDASGFGGEAYKWFKDDLEIAGQTGSTLIVDKTNKGFYRCEITNSQYPNLTLVSDAEDVGVFTNGIYNEEYDALVA
ncbi:MAG TPA: sugar-binding protein, partial [Prolixibacteraceae bacterium]|nr:sugar-binding protein [Prolixibacteraceae bacterium]